VDTAPTGISVEFDSSIQTLGALEAAAYRLIGTATCQIERNGDRFVCHLTPKTRPASREQLSGTILEERFLEYVTDENPRVRVAGEELPGFVTTTEPDAQKKGVRL
jgi:hypothetical protein